MKIKSESCQNSHQTHFTAAGPRVLFEYRPLDAEKLALTNYSSQKCQIKRATGVFAYSAAKQTVHCFVGTLLLTMVTSMPFLWLLRIKSFALIRHLERF